MKGKFGGGDGSALNPYIIEDDFDFFAMEYQHKFFKLNQNISVFDIKKHYFFYGTLLLNGFELFLNWESFNEDKVFWCMGNIFGGRVFFNNIAEGVEKFIGGVVSHCELIFKEKNVFRMTYPGNTIFNYCKITWEPINTNIRGMFQNNDYENRNFYNTLFVQPKGAFNNLDVFLNLDPENKNQVRLVHPGDQIVYSKQLPKTNLGEAIVWTQSQEFWKNDKLWWEFLETYQFSNGEKTFIFDQEKGKLVESNNTFSKIELSKITEQQWIEIKKAWNIQLIQKSNYNGKRFDIVVKQGAINVADAYSLYDTTTSTLAVI